MNIKGESFGSQSSLATSGSNTSGSQTSKDLGLNSDNKVLPIIRVFSVLSCYGLFVLAFEVWYLESYSITQIFLPSLFYCIMALKAPLQGLKRKLYDYNTLDDLLNQDYVIVDDVFFYIPSFSCH